MENKEQIYNKIIKLKKILKKNKFHPSVGGNRKTFIKIVNAQKQKRKVTTWLYKDQIQCRVQLPACYQNKYVKVIIVNKKDTKIT